MKNAKTQKIITGLLSLFFAGVLLAFALFWMNRGKPEKTGRDVVIFGDSIMAYSQDDSSVANYLSAETGLDVLDLSFGGTLMSCIYEESTPAMQRNALSMYMISKAFVSDDFSQQKAYHPMEPATEYFGSRIEDMQRLDLKSTKTVIIGQCINDYHCGITAGDVNSASEYTYCGALNMVILYLRRINPDIRIIIVSPTPKWTDSGNEAMDMNLGGGTLRDFMRMQKEVAEKNGVEYISLLDVYDTPLDTSEGYMLGKSYTVDGTHPNLYARKAIAEKIARYLKETEDDN